MSNAQGVKENQSSVYVHGDNLYKKISDKEKDGKYGDDESQKLLKEIEKQYLVWKIENETKMRVRTGEPLVPVDTGLLGLRGEDRSAWCKGLGCA